MSDSKTNKKDGEGAVEVPKPLPIAPTQLWRYRRPGEECFEGEYGQDGTGMHRHQDHRLREAEREHGQ